VSNENGRTSKCFYRRENNRHTRPADENLSGVGANPSGALLVEKSVASAGYQGVLPRMLRL
jgi:hypothetical protein